MILYVGAGCAVSGGRLADQLERLAVQTKFAIEGLDILQDDPFIDGVEGQAPEQVETLLRDYNYLVIWAGPGKIEKVLITSRKVPADRSAPDDPEVPLVKVGAHHQVHAELFGPNRTAVPVSLLLDTGASTLVLPLSLAETLGFELDDFADSVAEGVGGRVPAKVGVLPKVQLGSIAVADVRVSFLPDDKLNGVRLLGMSFLERFRFTIDDTHQRLILLAK